MHDTCNMLHVKIIDMNYDTRERYAQNLEISTA